MKLAEFRKKYPQYDTMEDKRLLEKIHKKYYPEMSFYKFVKKVTLSSTKGTLKIDGKVFSDALEKIQTENTTLTKSLVDKLGSLTDNRKLMEFLLKMPDVLKRHSDNNMQMVMSTIQSMPVPVVKADVTIQEDRPQRWKIHSVLRDGNRDVKSFEMEAINKEDEVQDGL